MRYEWKCKVCGTTVEVDRSVSEYNAPPTTAEAGKTDDCLHPEWVKVYTSSTPFEMLRDRGVLDRTHWKRGT
jgi:hypothetical protein